MKHALADTLSDTSVLTGLGRDTGMLRKFIVAAAISGRLRGSERDLGLAQQCEPLASEGAAGGSASPQSVASPGLRDEELPLLGAHASRFERLRDLALIDKGRTGIKEAVPGAYPLVVTGEVRQTCDHYDFDRCAAIIPLVSSSGHGHASIKRLHYQDGKFALGTILCAVTSMDERILSTRFLFEYLVAFKDELLVSRMSGTANVSLTLSKVGEVPVPIIPLAVQDQVVRLMSTCDQLEQVETERTAHLDAFVASVLRSLDSPAARLTGADDASTGASEEFALDHLDLLTSRREHLPDAWSAILSLAFRGRMSHPDGRSVQGAWPLVPLGKVASITDGTHKTPTYLQSGVPFISVKDFSGGALSFEDTRFISEQEHNALCLRCRPRRGDVLLGRIGTLGKAVVVDTDRPFSLFVSVALIRVSAAVLRPEFLAYWLNSPWAMREFDKIKVGGGTHTNKLNLRDLRNLAMPIPPLEEQLEVLKRLAAHQALLEKLDSTLLVSETTRHALLAAAIDSTLQS